VDRSRWSEVWCHASTIVSDVVLALDVGGD